MGSVVAGEGPTAYLLALFFRWDFSDPFDVCLGYPVLRYLTQHPWYVSLAPLYSNSRLGVVFISPTEKVAIGDEIPLFCY